MFNRKKRIYEKKGFYILIMSALLIALGIFAVPWGGGQKQDAGSASAQTAVPEDENWWEDDEEDEEEYSDENDAGDTDKNSSQDSKTGDIDRSQLPYYMAVEENGLISVYYYDKNGNISKYKDTEITYSLLNEADQLSFSQGIMVKTKDALTELLQDFES